MNDATPMDGAPPDRSSLDERMERSMIGRSGVRDDLLCRGCWHPVSAHDPACALCTDAGLLRRCVAVVDPVSQRDVYGRYADRLLVWRELGGGL